MLLSYYHVKWELGQDAGVERRETSPAPYNRLVYRLALSSVLFL